jgi:hypothetical protein
MADLDATFVQKILHVPKRKRKLDVHHHRQADHLRAGFEVAKWRRFCHPVTLAGANPAGKKVPLTLPPN